MHRFDAWLFRVDDLLIHMVGLDSGSMEDWLWHDAFDAGMLPKEAVNQFLAEQRFFDPIMPAARAIGTGQEDIHESLETI